MTENANTPWAKMLPGDRTTVEVTTIKFNKGKPTVIAIGPDVYILRPAGIAERKRPRP